MHSDHDSTESVSFAWPILCDVLFVLLIHESWHTLCATPKSTQKAPGMHGKENEAC